MLSVFCLLLPPQPKQKRDAMPASWAKEIFFLDPNYGNLIDNFIVESITPGNSFEKTNPKETAKGESSGWKFPVSRGSSPLAEAYKTPTRFSRNWRNVHY